MCIPSIQVDFPSLFTGKMAKVAMKHVEIMAKAWNKGIYLVTKLVVNNTFCHMGQGYLQSYCVCLCVCGGVIDIFYQQMSGWYKHCINEIFFLFYWIIEETYSLLVRNSYKKW